VTGKQRSAYASCIPIDAGVELTTTGKGYQSSPRLPNGFGQTDQHLKQPKQVRGLWPGDESSQVAPVNTIRIRLGHESLDVTLAYLKGKDAESEEAQEHASSSSLALYA